MSTLSVGTIKSNTSAPPVIQNTSGTEIGTFCRAWVNFNGTGTVAIRASFNVSSITDNGTGNYTVNFANAMPDVNFCTQASCLISSATIEGIQTAQNGNTVSSCTVLSRNRSTGTAYDSSYVDVVIFR